jgi:quercetin dioxygenase-like cupin family protein
VRLFRFDPPVAHPITQWESRNVAVGRGVRIESGEWIQVSCFHFEADGCLGFHPSVGPQLMMVVAGDGWVRGNKETRTPIRTGQAAFWKAGEWHESGSEQGMTAVVVDGDGVDPAVFMPELQVER